MLDVRSCTSIDAQTYVAVHQMTYRRVLNHLTREQVKPKAEAAFYERTQAALCEVDYARFEELDRKIKEAMAALPDSYREAFVMHRFKELSYKEIAEVLDVSPQTVAYRIQQALSCFVFP